MLSTALDIGTGKHAKLAGWQIGGKTGTSQKARDALFVGFTSRMVTGVWLGNDDDTGTSLAGGTVPTQIWSDFMAKAHEGLTPQNLPDASSAAVPATELQPNDPIGALAADGTQQPGGTGLAPNGTPLPADGTQQPLPADGTQPPPTDLTGAQPQQPQQPAKRSPKTIGDMLKGLFGGGN
jgi:penicillin-binding protein 1A